MPWARRWAWRWRSRRWVPAPPPVCSDLVPAMYDFLPELTRVRQAPDPELDYDLIVVGDCGDLRARRIGAPGPRRALWPGAHRGHRSPHLERGLRRRGLDRSQRRGDVRDGDAAAACARGPDRRGRRRDRGEPDGRRRRRHGQRSSIPTPRRAPCGWRASCVAAGAPLSTSRGASTGPSPTPSCKLFGLVLARLETALDGRLVWSIAARRQTSMRPAPRTPCPRA